MCVGLYINIRWHEFVWVYMCELCVWVCTCVCVYCGAQIACAHYTCAQCVHVCGSGMCGEIPLGNATQHCVGTGLHSLGREASLGS